MSKTFPVTMGRSGIQMVENLRVYDMIWGMCNLNRFTGKADRQVNVAAHSLHCFAIAKLWQPENTDLHLYALTHDLPEAYYGDFPGFLKPELGPDFVSVLARIDDVVFSQLGLGKDVRLALESDLKRVDCNALALEAEYGFDNFEPYHWPKPDLYDKLDVISQLASFDSVSLYNLIGTELETIGDTNEALSQLLHRNRGQSHPRRDGVR